MSRTRSIGVWRGGRWNLNVGIGRYWCSVDLARCSMDCRHSPLGFAVSVPFVAVGWFKKRIPRRYVVEAFNRCGVDARETKDGLLLSKRPLDAGENRDG